MAVSRESRAPAQPNFTEIRKFVINLDHRHDRLAQTQAYLGDTFTRVPAVNGREMTLLELDAAFDVRKAVKTYLVNLTPVQASCTLSHMRCYQQIVEDNSIAENEWVMIAEDDNAYDYDFPTKLEQLVFQLNQERFEYAEMCVLRNNQFPDQIDYYEALGMLSRKHRFVRDLPPMKSGLLNPVQRELLDGSDMFFFIRHNNKTNYPFMYQGISESEVPELYTNKQNLFAPYFMAPQSSACYLIRKSVCRRVLNQHERPFWYADDFKQMVPVQSILYVSPFLAFAPEENDSNIVEPWSEFNHYFNKVTRNLDRLKSEILKRVWRVVNWYYSDNKYKRRAACAVANLLGLRNQVGGLALFASGCVIGLLVVLLYAIIF